MSRIDDLIQELCPDGVPFYELSSVAGYSRERINASELDSTSFVGVDNLLPDKQGKEEASYLPNTQTLIRYRINDVLIGNIRPYLRKIWLATSNGGNSGDVLCLRIAEDFTNRITPSFFYYVLSSEDFFEYNIRYSKGAKMPRGDKSVILRYRFPVPPIAVQREIVRILDKFTQLEAELEAELEARRAQYEFYRNRFFNYKYKNGIILKPLGEVGRFIRGSGIQKSDLHSYGFPAIHYGQIHTIYGVWTKKTKSHVTQKYANRLKHARTGDLLIATTSEDDKAVAKATAWMGDSEVAVGGDAFIFRHSLDPKYVAYYFQTEQFQKLKSRFITGTKVRRISSASLSKILVPVPPLEEQRRIADILDKFEALVNDLSVGLPAELKARRQQYEYYRDRLLTFKELPA